MTGTIKELLFPKKTACIIQSGAIEVFSHQREFLDPAEMLEGQEVSFRLKEVQRGDRPEATDVRALRKAA